MRVLALLAILAGPLFAQELTAKNYRKYRDHILPSARESIWERIDWRPTFWDAVLDAHKAKKPILLYAMNGHTMGHV